MIYSPEVEVVNVPDVTVSTGVSVTNFPATQPVSGSVNVSNFPATQPVSGPLTDAELRATPVPISGTVSTTVANASTSNVAQVSVPNSGSTSLLTPNANRKRFILYVASKAAFIKIGTAVTNTSFTYSLPVNSTLELAGWTGDVTALGIGGTSNINVTELI